jgi:hypothetical protein
MTLSYHKDYKFEVTTITYLEAELVSIRVIIKSSRYYLKTTRAHST